MRIYEEENKQYKKQLLDSYDFRKLSSLYQLGQKNRTSLQQRAIKIFFQNPYFHDGSSFSVLDCSKKKNIFTLRKDLSNKENIFKSLWSYFERRCDLNVERVEDVSERSDYFLRYSNVYKQQNFRIFEEEKQVINHIENLKALLDDKDGLVK